MRNYDLWLVVGIAPIKQPPMYTFFVISLTAACCCEFQSTVSYTHFIYHAEMSGGRGLECAADHDIHYDAASAFSESYEPSQRQKQLHYATRRGKLSEGRLPSKSSLNTSWDDVDLC